MQSFNFKVVRSDGGSEPVPVSVAGQTMVDIQRLLTDVGSLMVRTELRIQGRVPEELVRRFDLSVSGSSGADVGATSKGDDTLMLDALRQVFRELELANSQDTLEEPVNHLEALGRRAIAKDLLQLADHLDGYDLMYGSGEPLRKFKLTRRDFLTSLAEDGATTMPSTLIGVIARDPAKRNRWVISNGASNIPITFASNVPATDIPVFMEAGPLIASGTVVVDGSGDVTELRGATGCFSFPSVKFHRAITADRDIVLLNPLEGTPGYNAAKGLWTLENDDLGISVSKPGWDACVAAFHEYFAFLWETYAESEDEFEGEEKDIRDLLLSMMPVSAE